MLVALAVLSTATYIAIWAFSQSVSLGDNSLCRSTAAALAEERLVDLQHNPGAYGWPLGDALAKGSLAPITLKNAARTADGFRVNPPTVLPASPRLEHREKAFYDRFTWDAYARLPKPDAGYYEVSVAVQWYEGARKKLVALTTAIPRGRVEGVS
jgi:hypothetical protein